MTSYLRYGLIGGALGVFVGVCRVIDWSKAGEDTLSGRKIRRTIGVSTLVGMIAGPLIGHILTHSSHIPSP